MSIATRIEAIEQHLTDDYSVLELAGADLTNVDKNIENLKQSWEERLLYFLANGTDVVWNNWLPKVTGSGETITLNNTIEAKMEFVYKGNTYQETTTGKNLFDNVYGQTRNVYTKHIDASSPLGSLDCYPINLLPNTQYTLKIDMNGYQKTGAWIAGVCFENGDAISLLQSNSMADITTTTFTTDSTGFVYVGQRYGFTYGETGRMDLFLQTAKIQLEKGSTATDWEKYSGGNPTPNPDYPQDIQVVSGDNSIKVEGKNLFNKNNITSVINGSLSNNVIISNAISSDYGGVSANINNLNLSSGTYYISMKVKRASGTNAYNINRITLTGIDSSQITMIEKPTLSGEYQVYMCSINSSASISLTNIGIQLQTNNNSVVLNIKDIMISKSNNNIYQEYQGQTYPINIGNIELCKIGDYQDKIAKSTGKNLFDKDTIEEGKRLGSDGLPFTDTSFDLSDYIKVDSNTQYTYSRGSNGSGSSAIAYYDSSKTFISRTMPIMDSNAREVVLTTPNNATYVRIADLKTTLDSMQFEKGNQATTYEPYGKVWYLNKQIGKVVLNGSESWVHEAGSQTPTPRTVVTINSINFLNDNYYSNYFILNSTTSNRIVLRTVDSQLYLSLENELAGIINSDTNQQKVDKIKSWLSAHNTIVYYVLATPTYEEITDSTLIYQLEAIKKSYNNQTNISQENSKEAFILDVTALGN